MARTKVRWLPAATATVELLTAADGLVVLVLSAVYHIRMKNDACKT